MQFYLVVGGLTMLCYFGLGYVACAMFTRQEERMEARRLAKCCNAELRAESWVSKIQAKAFTVLGGPWE